MSKEPKREWGALIWLVNGQYCVTHGRPECFIPARLDGQPVDLGAYDSFKAICAIGKRQQGVESITKVDVDKWTCDTCKQPLRLHKEG